MTYNREGNRLETFEANLRREFARYGFINCPLSAAQIRTLWAANISEDNAYSIGTDVACGFTFKEARRAALAD